MDEVKTTSDIDNALESTAGTVLGFDTVAVWDDVVEMYGIYTKANESRWMLIMTSFTLDNIMEK